MSQVTMSKVWFVTGGGRGIGAGVVHAALQAGHRVVVTGRNLDALRRTFPDAAADQVAFVQLDVVDEAQARAAVDAAVARFGRIDILLNNAGFSLLGNFEEFTSAQVQKQFATNFFGVANVMRAVLPVMRRQRSGHIINVSSLAGAVGFKHCGAYGAAKFAVEGLSLAVAPEVEPVGIKVTVVEPGFFRTGLLDASSVEWAENVIDDYGAAGNVQATWEPYDGTQQGDPLKLGEALVTIAAMEKPPRHFVGGSDALAVVIPALEARVQEIRQHAELSKSTDGNF
jgi:NAD(P)-dependent dehydrogenase (short-subunit alcohol dehydrogenase family)